MASHLRTSVVHDRPDLLGDARHAYRDADDVQGRIQRGVDVSNCAGSVQALDCLVDVSSEGRGHHVHTAIGAVYSRVWSGAGWQNERISAAMTSIRGSLSLKNPRESGHSPGA